MMAAFDGQAHAQYSATAEVERPMAAPLSEEPTVAAHIVETAPRIKTLETVDELMLEVPGTRLQRFGGFGSFTALSLRGAEFDHTTVLFGNIPLRSADGGAFDLSSIPLSVVQRTEVYRGAAPAWLGSSAIGGVLQLIPQQAEASAVEFGVGAGSFGLLDTHGATSVVTPEGLRWTAIAGVAHSDNDFQYKDERGTHFDSTDDVLRRRRNAELLQAHTLLHAIASLWDGELEALMFGFERTGGEAGPAFQGSEFTHRTLSRYLTALRYSRASNATTNHHDWRWQLMGSAAYSRNRFTDQLGEIGLGQRITDDRSLLTQLRGAGELQLQPWLALTGVLHWDHERFAPEDAMAPFMVGVSDRDHIGATVETLLEGRLATHRWQIRPSLRMELISTRLTSIRTESLGSENEDLIVAPTFRLGSALQLSRDLSLAASMHSSMRVPSVVELFGDRGFLLGNTDLKPERALSADAGLNLQTQTGPLQTQAQVRGFVTSMRDLIVFSRINAQGLYGPRNTDEALLYGIEANADVTLWQRFILIGNVTAMRTQNTFNQRELPLRPRLQGYMRSEYRLSDIGFVDTASFFIDMQYRSNLFSDVINSVMLPEQWVFGTGMRMHMFEKLEVAASLRNIFDATVRDVVAFPLPGRSYTMELTWHTPLD